MTAKFDARGARRRIRHYRERNGDYACFALACKGVAAAVRTMSAGLRAAFADACRPGMPPTTGSIQHTGQLLSNGRKPRR